MPFQLSPGVAVVEKDFTSIVPAVSSSIGAFAGNFSWGPVLQPTTVSSENELVRRFGKPNDDNFRSFFTAANFLSYTNNLLLARVDTGSLNAVATVTGGVTSISVGTAGSGYTSTSAPPAVTIGAPGTVGGVQATATATLSGGAITAIALASAGTGYDTAPTVVITAVGADTGTGATATATMDAGLVTGITITAGGSGYKTAPTVTLVGGTPSVAATIGSVTIGASSITGVVVTNPGTGYSSAPAIAIDAPPSGVTAIATANTVSAGVKIINSESYLSLYSNGAGVVGAWAAKYPGKLGNSLKVSMADATSYAAWVYKAEFDGAPGTSSYAASVNPTPLPGTENIVKDEMHIIIIDAEGAITGTREAVLEKFSFVSKASDAKKSDGTNNYYKDVINSRSEWIYWMDHLELGTNWGNAAAGTTYIALTNASTISLSGGTDVTTATTAQRNNAYALFADAEQYDISLVLLGRAGTPVANFVINNVCETRLDCIAFISPEDVTTGDVIIGASSTQVDQITAFRDQLPSTSYAVLDTGYKYQYDRYNDKYRYVPLNGDVAGLCARTDYTNDPWFSPGGLNRGQIKNVVKLAVSPNKTMRDTLYKKGVNPVVTFPGEGTVLFGDKTLLAKPSAFDRINVRRLFIVMEKAIATAAKFQLFEFNDGFTRAQFKNLVEPFLRDVQGRRGITDFVVKCDESNNTGEVIDRNEFVADIFVKPNRSINFITLNFVAARSAINFSEIGA
jgi:phage tail sheath protein FI